MAAGAEQPLNADDVGAAFTQAMDAIVDEWHRLEAEANGSDRSGPGVSATDGQGESTPVGSVLRPARWRLRSSYLDRQTALPPERKLAARSRLAHGDGRDASVPSAAPPSDVVGAAEICRLESEEGAAIFSLADGDIYVTFEGSVRLIDFGHGPLILESEGDDGMTFRVANLSLDELDAALDVIGMTPPEP